MFAWKEEKSARRAFLDNVYCMEKLIGESIYEQNNPPDLIPEKDRDEVIPETEGLVRGQLGFNARTPIMIPMSRCTLGHMTREPIDERIAVDTKSEGAMVTRRAKGKSRQEEGQWTQMPVGKMLEPISVKDGTLGQPSKSILASSRKLVYSKDDPFDSSSCDALDRGGRFRFSEHYNTDTQTFASFFRRSHMGRGGRNSSYQGSLRGSYYGGRANEKLDGRELKWPVTDPVACKQLAEVIKQRGVLLIPHRFGCPFNTPIDVIDYNAIIKHPAYIGKSPYDSPLDFA